ncbi:hypothetical protein HELRODRAFT_186154 [Helobdella robusta]|uniref:Citrate transporter-like domain-containing protein n=1 Tax=Helobdella robusta TaxID=6412 RepID=T1FNQ8_HELRO|nr:hypothetical protein HELRODRAFT_186154 [Helobdella robusta]ESN92181.1 hypothetical protein HELRODRAFT_186154 [Helobdella robusta]
MAKDVEIRDSTKPSIWKQIMAIKDTLIIILTPIILLPLPIVWSAKQGRCAYVILIMIVYWMTEVIPMAVTALIPIVLFPWLGVMGSKELCVNYLKDANMLFFGGLLVAVAVEKWNLHKRVALRVLMLVGSKPKWIIFGFMVVTAFLSMWLNNTATTAMMMPIAHAVLTELDDNRKKQMIARNASKNNLEEKKDANNDHAIEMKEIATDGAESHLLTVKTDQAAPVVLSKEDEESNKRFASFRTALKLCVPYASSIGGCGTLIGCGPNIVLKGQLEVLYSSSSINFTSWLVIGFPAMVVDLLLAWVFLLIIFFGARDTFGLRKQTEEDKDETANQVIKAEYQKLGSITFAEVVVLVNFLILAFLWVSREPEFVPGWGKALNHTTTKTTVKHYYNGSKEITVTEVPASFVTDASVAITICVLLFIFPSQWPSYLCFRKKTETRAPGLAPPILDWPTANKQMPWSVILLLGGGFALADACKGSKLSDSVGEALISLKDLHPFFISLIMTLVATVITQFTSNMATTTIMIPILAQVAAKTCVNPIYLMLPVTLASSFAFILPVGTPPNAIAHSYGDITIPQMIKAGLAMCLITNVVLVLSINTWGYAFFDLGTWPSWAPPCANSTVEVMASVTPMIVNTTTAPVG